uniref:Uncharacterized protein n=1 Tax=Anguilla anguilla TaxID=7936 RepID=A0A0E9X5F7_ANGAN
MRKIKTLSRSPAIAYVELKPKLIIKLHQKPRLKTMAKRHTVKLLGGFSRDKIEHNFLIEEIKMEKYNSLEVLNLAADAIGSLVLL